jgi:hypothetical protein
MKKNLAPPVWPIRNPRTLPKVVGKVHNPPKGVTLGGKGENANIPLKGSPFRVTARGR